MVTDSRGMIFLFFNYNPAQGAMNPWILPGLHNVIFCGEPCHMTSIFIFNLRSTSFNLDKTSFACQR